jgi:ABC-2 type transport system permease protein
VRPAWLITLKELRVQVRRRSLFVLGFVAPLSLAFVMNLVFGGIDDPDAPVTFDVGLVVLDDGDVADGFVAAVESIAETGLLDLREIDSEDAARSAVDDGDVGAVWVVPDGFSDGASSAEGGAVITVIADVDSPTTASVARSIADGFATRLGTGRMAGLVALETGVAGPDDIAEIAGEVAQEPALLTIAASDSRNEMLDTGTTLMAGMALFFAFFTAGMPLLGIIEERSNSTLLRLLVAPIPEWSIVAGKTLAALVLGSVSLIALIVSSSLLMGIDWGPLTGAIPLSVAAIVSVAGIMSIAGSAAKTPENAGNVQAIVAVALALLGGAFMPIPATGGLLSILQKFTPHGWYMDGLEALQSGDTAGAITAAVVLAGIGTVTLALGSSLARRSLRS